MSQQQITPNSPRFDDQQIRLLDEQELASSLEQLHAPHSAAALAEKVLGLVAFGRRTDKTELIEAKSSSIISALGVRYGISPEETLLQRRISKRDRRNPSKYVLYSFSPDVQHRSPEIPIAVIALALPGQVNRIVTIDSIFDKDSNEMQFKAWTFDESTNRRIPYRNKRIGYLVDLLDEATEFGQEDHVRAST